MDRNQDFRFDANIFREMIGEMFVKYRCDQFLYTNSVTGIVGLYIGDKVYELHNEQEEVDYYIHHDDFALWKIFETEDKNIHSFFIETDQIDTPVNEIINKISLVNENQKVTIEGINYNVWITRAIIFHLDSKDIYFEKDNTAFSEEIEIKRGHDLLKEFPKYNDFFMEEWLEDIKPEVRTEFVTIE